MKRIDCIIRPAKLEALKDALLDSGFSGMTIEQVQGCGNQHGWKEYYRGSEVIVNTVPKIKVSIVAVDDQVDGIIDAVCSVARTGQVGDGKIFVTPVEEVVRIRTGERGALAV